METNPNMFSTLEGITSPHTTPCWHFHLNKQRTMKNDAAYTLRGNLLPLRCTMGFAFHRILYNFMNWVRMYIEDHTLSIIDFVNWLFVK